MRRLKLNILDTMSLSHLGDNMGNPSWGEPSPANWIRILRTQLRMTQAELARRAKITQPHLAGIESGKTDLQVSTLKRIFDAMSCDIIIKPQPRKPIEERLRGQARSIALKRLKQSMGTMALEGQAPNADIFKQLLEKKTDEIMNDRREHLWRETND